MAPSLVSPAALLLLLVAALCVPSVLCADNPSETENTDLMVGDPGTFFMARVVRYHEFKRANCTAVLLSAHHVITAAKCIVPGQPLAIEHMVGRHVVLLNSTIATATAFQYTLVSRNYTHVYPLADHAPLYNSALVILRLADPDLVADGRVDYVNIHYHVYDNRKLTLIRLTDHGPGTVHPYVQHDVWLHQCGPKLLWCASNQTYFLHHQGISTIWSDRGSALVDQPQQNDPVPLRLNQIPSRRLVAIFLNETTLQRNPETGERELLMAAAYFSSDMKPIIEHILSLPGDSGDTAAVEPSSTPGPALIGFIVAVISVLLTALGTVIYFKRKRTAGGLNVGVPNVGQNVPADGQIQESAM